MEYYDLRACSWPMTTRTRRSVSRFVLRLFVVLFGLGCGLPAVAAGKAGPGIAAPATVERTPVRKNQPPRVAALYGEVDGQRVRLIRPGMAVTVRARATDPEGDALEYRWVLDSAGGSIDSPDKPVVHWKVGKSGVLHLIVRDRHGAYDHAYLPVGKAEGIVFAGRVTSNLSQGLNDVLVDVNGETTRTFKGGYFTLWVNNSEAYRFVFNLSKPGYSPVSRIYDTGIQRGQWTMNLATTVAVDPSQAIQVADANSQLRCLGQLSGRVDWSRYPVQRIPRFVDAFANLTTGPVPAELQRALDALADGTECSPGLNVSIPANALVDSAGRPPKDKVDVTVSTVDLYAPDSMPGDFTVEVEGGSRWMQSFGAGTVSVSANGKAYQLRKGAHATLTIPVDPLQLKLRAKLEPTIPLLLYDDKRGVWVVHGEAKLNKEGDAYVGEVRHFTAFNTDLIKTDQSCVRFDASAMPDNFDLEVIIPMGDQAAPVVKTFDVSPDPAQPNEDLHAIVNLPRNTWILLIAIEEPTPGDFVPLGAYMVNTGPPQVPADPNRPPYPYDACQSEVALAPVPSTDYVVDGSGRGEGPLPVHIYALADETTGLLGSRSFYLFGLFDTGSTRVRIYNEQPYWFSAFPDPNGGLVCDRPNRVTDGNWWWHDAGYLGLAGPEVVRLRLNGLSQIRPDLTAPIDAVGTPDEPQVEVRGVQVELPSGPLDVTLVGSPVTHLVTGLIDYTSQVAVGGYQFYCSDVNGDGVSDCLSTAGNAGIPGFQLIDTVRGPDITFYAPTDPTIPFGDFGLMLELERFGMPERYYLKNVTLREGAALASDQDPTSPINLLYDTGTTRTFITDAVAGQLGLGPVGDFDCYGPTVDDNKGYVLDEIVMVGDNGTYTVQNAAVCWDQSRVQQPTLYQVVVGSNLFDQVPVLVDGPRNRLGIGAPTAAPVAWEPLPRNCVN